MHPRRLLPPPLTRLADDQAGCLSRAQLREVGVGADHVARLVRSGRWQRVGSLVVACHNGPLDRRAQLWASVLMAGDHGVLAGPTALELHGLRGWERREVHVAVPRGRRTPGLPWTDVRTTRRVGARDVVRRAGLPLHRVERAAVDLAGAAATARTAGGLLAAVVQQRLSTPARLRDALDADRQVRHRRELVAVLDDLEGGSQAMSEVDLVRLCRRHRLPVPSRQVVRTDATGRRRYLDAEWELADGRRVLCEVDGMGHLDIERWYDDCLRAAEVSAPGDTVLRLPSRAFRADAPRVAALLWRHLR